MRCDSATRVAGMVEFCRQDLLARGLPPPYRLLALSLGGMVAVEWASTYPQEIASCVLINTSMRPYSPFYRRLRWQNYPALLRQLLLGRPGQPGSADFKADQSPNMARAMPALVRSMAGVPAAISGQPAQCAAPAAVGGPLSRPGQPPAMPLLVLAGGRDRLVDPGCSRRLARAWQTACEIHPDAGHDLPLDQPDWVAQTVAQWLGGADRKTG